MNEKQNQPLMTNAEYGAFKRLWEYYGANPSWRESFLKNPVKHIKEFPEISDVYKAFKAVGMLSKNFGGDKFPINLNPYYDEYMRRYNNVREFLNERFKEERFNDRQFFLWNEIALRRAKIQVKELRNTPTFRFFPLIFELSDGCKEQCSYCGLAAVKHNGDFLATPQNIELWRDILATSREVIGNIASESACYFATEPFNNPDYEILLSEFASVMGNYPQTTTVLAAKEPSRIRRLMDMIGKERMSLAALRFSARSLHEFQRIMEEYSPEELADVEIIPQNPESGTSYSRSGRLYNGKLPKGKMVKDYSISCVAGFRVNMARKSVAFMEPTIPSADYPTGVHIRGEKSFADKKEYKRILKDFINYFAVCELPYDRELTIPPNVSVTESERYLLFQGDGVSLRVGGNLHFRQTVKYIMNKPSRLIKIFDKIGVGEFIGSDIKQKLQILYEKGYLTSM